MATFTLSLAEPTDLEVRRLQLSESLSAPFEIDLVCASRDAGLDLDALVGTRAHLAIDRGTLGARGWGGICSSIEALPGEGEGLFFYAIRIAPEMERLAYHRDAHAFVEASAIDIATRLLRSVDAEPVTRLTRAHRTHALRTQRGETSLHFVERLLEDAGVSFTFADAPKPDEMSKVVLFDAPERGEPRLPALPVMGRPDSALASPFATNVRTRASLRTGAVTEGAFDFRRPRFQPTHHAKSAGHGEAKLEDKTFSAAAEGESEREGSVRADDRLAGMRFERDAVTFTTNVVGLSPGDAIDLAGRKGKPERLIVTRNQTHWRQDTPFEAVITAVPAGAPIRPERRAERPRTPEVESAFVVGPEGSELHTDEHGRVQLRFAWDHAPESKAPWARVDATWAGAGYGAMALPRVGSEVLVGYLHGDADHPVVTGRVFNGADAPPQPLPHGATKLTWRSRGTPEGEGGHELTFDDKKGAELVRLRSERDLTKVVNHDERSKVLSHATSVVTGSLATSVGELDLVEVGSLHEVRMTAPSDGDGAETAPLDTRREIVARRITLTTGGATIVLDGPDIVIAGEKSVRIVAGGNVSVQGEPYVHINPPAAKGPTAASEKGAVSDHVAWFRLHSDGRPLAGVRVHLLSADDPSADPRVHETDGNGEVRVPLAKPESFHAKVAHGSEHTPEGIPVATVPSQPTARAKPVDHDVPIKIHVIHPDPNETFHLHTTPDMPEIPIEAKVIVGGKPYDAGQVGWTFRLEGQYRVRSGTSGFREQSYRLRSGHVMTTPGEHRKYRLDAGELVGGSLHLDVHFAGGEALGGLRASKRVTGMRVLGKNAAKEDVEKYIAERGGPLAWVYLRMFSWESIHRLAQFAESSGGGNTPGQPLYGPPSGVGIVQRDPTSDEWDFPKSPITEPNNFFPRIFWNWKHNVNEGIASFKSTYIERGRADLDALRHAHPNLPKYSEGVLMRASIRRYNGGTEYVASGDGRHYVVSPDSTNPGYVLDVLNEPIAEPHKYPVPHDARATEWP